ncbi:cyclin-dependent kinase inhibitor 1 isoform X2 [Denticeps clupeoides]|uniref:Cyclin-dependent kinase inhibitor domain-containing protein n=1 Tax=Denticeps clupeoides TaxID=299321 RepID=A0AAY4C6K9_9TELE|nr:cyclin-dependent kinase inhibitor 1 isoform X2 [Denticeps clupeoides]
MLDLYIDAMSFHQRVLRSLGNGPVRRNLFGPVDREQLQLDYHRSLRKDLEDASRRWGFDFLTDTPLEGGDFQWEGVLGTKVPQLYRCDMPREDVLGYSGKENVSHALDQSQERTPEKCSRSLKRKQTNITDFYQAKRRVVATPRKSGQ